MTYIQNAFAIGGVTTPIPQPIQGSGNVSWTEGFGIDYTQQLGVVPTAKAILQGVLNELFFVLSQEIQQYQQNGVPYFITSADNGGIPYPYAVNAIVRYNPGSGYKLYLSLIDGNTDTPPSLNWQELNFSNFNSLVTSAQLQNQTYTYTQSLSAAPSFAVTLTPGYSPVTSQQSISIEFANQSVGGDTLDVNGTGAKEIVVSVPNYGLRKISQGEIAPGSTHYFIKYTSPDAWYMVDSNSPKCIYGQTNLTVTQSEIGAGTYLINFDTNSPDPYNIFSTPSQAAVSVTGRYQVTFSAQGSSSGTAPIFLLYRNSSPVVALTKNSDTSFVTNASYSLNCNLGDLLQIYVTFAGSFSINITFAVFQIEYLGPSDSIPV